MPRINFFEFRRLISTGKLGGLILNIDAGAALGIIKKCKFYGIPNLLLIRPQSLYPVYQFNPNKGLLVYVETNLIDSCNLNCAGCTHYANLFDDNDFYPLEKYERDLRNFSATVDLLELRLMGGEPFKLPNLIDYIRLARKYFPQTDIRVVTNGLLIPSAPQDLFDAIRDNKIIVDISMYPPTEKVIDKIQEILKKNEIPFRIAHKVNYFAVSLSLSGGHDPAKSRKACVNDGCRFMRDGKIYKCPIDALSYKFAEKFGIKGFPKPTGVTIGTPNFVSLLERLNGDVECCYWCDEKARPIKWKSSHKPALEEWLANPMETLNLCRF